MILLRSRRLPSPDHQEISMRLYDNASSGNAYKVRLLLALLGLQATRIEIDVDTGETRTPEFLARNPNGRVPVLQLDDGRCLAESNAILCYLGTDSRFLPAQAWSRAKVLEWMFFEQYSHEPYIAVSRYILTHLPADSPRRGELPGLRPRGEAALAVMEQHLAREPYLVGASLSVADIALFAYTHVAEEGGFTLTPYPAVRAWVERCQAEPGHIAMDA
jgi:glutathione S-transferase